MERRGIVRGRSGSGFVQNPRVPSYATEVSFLFGARRRLGDDATNTAQRGREPAHSDAVTSLRR